MEKKYALRSHRHTGIEEDIRELRTSIRQLESRLNSAELHIPTVSVWSAGSDVCVGGPPGDKWHRIVCEYDGNRCLGGPRLHYHSVWQITEKGFSLFRFNSSLGTGWNGQYSKGMRYDEVVGSWGDHLKLHSNALYAHIKTEFSLWFPCHIYNDFTGDMYRP